MKNEDGGPAFPLHSMDGVIWEGMTKRDYYRAHAIEACIRLVGNGSRVFTSEKDFWSAVAKDCDMLATAMLALDDKEKP